MKKNLFIKLVFSLGFISCILGSYAQEVVPPGEIVPPGKVFISPDKMHSFKIEYYDREHHFVITDLNSHKNTLFLDEYAPIFAVQWTADSNSVFIAAHYARGKLLDMIHNDGQKWTLREITPPENREYESEILDWKFNKNSVHLIFKVMIYSRTAPEYYKCSFDFNPSNGSISNYKKSLVSMKKYIEIKSALAPD